MFKVVCCRFLVPFLALALVACSTPNTTQVGSAQDATSATGGRLVDSLGIKVSGLRLSAAGYMLDFRYRVIDPEKASPLMEYKVKPFMLVETTGARLDIPDTPKLGLLRQRPRNNSGAVKDHDYFIMFSNLGRRLKTGDKVSIVVGETVIEHLSIQ
jgi:hypothetical protein